MADSTPRSSSRAEYFQNESESDKWFRADLTGNSLLPQTGLGISLFMFAELLKNGLDSDKLQRFISYHPTDEQFEKAKNLMNIFHSEYEVDEEKNDQIIRNGLVEDLMMSVKELLMQELYYTLNRILDRKVEGKRRLSLSESNEKILELMQTAGYAEAVSLMQSLSSIGASVLLSESKGLCVEYKESVRKLNAQVLTEKQVRREEGMKARVLDVSDRVRNEGLPLRKIERKIVEAWEDSRELSSMNRDKLTKIMNGMQNEDYGTN